MAPCVPCICTALLQPYKPQASGTLTQMPSAESSAPARFVVEMEAPRALNTETCENRSRGRQRYVRSSDLLATAAARISGGKISEKGFEGPSIPKTEHRPYVLDSSGNHPLAAAIPRMTRQKASIFESQHFDRKVML
ncbi:hypothetical protein HETIRDRAFT_168909 [Heterobasidion irregulare TC 32-1]|uniref:Uncharacterized protein n=1 Tax=Heterobasidion irregulare (strain TC 32-1) TaxID=747525 RepID=W4K8M3_HETIT|nr:uncharacterized protein HETIRDRAFT_168909 [Heterobasidion irregulare TC 32-1]ETW82138.1 hypothetical protein HETIRDRAFT_168909 [Heterobasidion irregulare TC 32-1]